MPDLSSIEAEDRELACRAQAGSLPAFEDLVRRHQGRVYSFIRMQCGNASDAEEITQEVFVKAWRALEKWNNALSFKTWLFTIARHKCVDHYRVLSRTQQAGGLAPEVDERTPGEVMARREDADALWAAARELLPASQFQALFLRYAEDMPVREIARVMGRTATHVKVLLFRARTAMARRLLGRRVHAGKQNGFKTTAPETAASPGSAVTLI